MSLLLTLGCWAVVAASVSTTEGVPLRVTVVYDNASVVDGTESDWGFACLVESGSTTVLFDTGREGGIVCHNLEALAVDLAEVDAVVLSHGHGDHTGGLSAILAETGEVPVYFPASFPEPFAAEVVRAGAVAVPVADEALKVGPRLHLTGELGEEIRELALVVESARGPVVLTGCAHPGVATVVRRVREVLDRPVHLVMGGFHLGQMPPAEVERVVAELRELGVARVAPGHCTGQGAIAAFTRAWGEAFTSLGVGRVITVDGTAD